MEQLFYIAFGFSLAIVIGVVVYIANSLLKKYIKNEIARQLKDFDARRPKFFNHTKSDNTQIKSKIVANEAESVQNVSGQADSSVKEKEPEPPLWNNKEKLEKLRSQISDGNFEEFQNEETLANLPPLDALWKVDERIAEMEEMES